MPRERLQHSRFNDANMYVQDRNIYYKLISNNINYECSWKVGLGFGSLTLHERLPRFSVTLWPVTNLTVLPCSLTVLSVLGGK